MSELFSTESPGKAYLVLARKYRPQNFADLIGQEALVTTLSNAIKANRIHHAYVLTGIRGVGKTTTARILAKALNCENGPSITWDDADPQCKAIAEGRHVDVLEFDAASHTGIEDIKNLFEGVDYQPVQGRYKVYIIDEVHMLSTKAFNALLKTLEEPPPHVKFVFATTEVNKIPVTVLSRCQRFDLRRVPESLLEQHFANILQHENVTMPATALKLIARAADGSVRDGLSLLDQAIALSGDAAVPQDVVERMLGQADAPQLLDLLENLLAGKATETLNTLYSLYDRGHDPLNILQELMRLTHLMTRLKVVPNLAQSQSLSELEQTRAVPLAQNLKMETLARAYQMLLTSALETKQADRPLEVVEMALLRITHLAPLPAVEALLAQQGGKLAQPAAPAPQAATPAPQPAPQVAATEPAPWEDAPPPTEADPKPRPPVQ